MSLVYEEEQALQSLNQIAEVSQQVAAEPGNQEFVAADIGEIVRRVCRVYTPLKPTIESALWLVERIPVYGARIAGMVRLLMRLLDTVCQAV
jgi:hypothetical protein